MAHRPLVSHIDEDAESDASEDAEGVEDPRQLRIAGSTTEDEVSDDDGKRCQRRKRCLLVFAFCWLGALAVPGIFLMLPRAANFMLEDMAFKQVDIPGLRVGLVPADTSRCKSFDPCGFVEACSLCPANYVNGGCVCSPPKPGTIIESDHSTCPVHDYCGVLPPPFGAQGCSSCPDSSWINEGCTCQQPMSSDDVITAFDRFTQLVTFRDYPLSLVLEATVLVCNPNVAGVKTDPGALTLSWQGNVIGNASFQPLWLGAHGTSTVGPVRVTVDKVSTPVGLNILQELLKTNGVMEVDVVGSLTARVIGIFPVSTTVTCRVTANLKDAHILEKKQCTFTVSDAVSIVLTSDAFNPAWSC